MKHSQIPESSTVLNKDNLYLKLSENISDASYLEQLEQAIALVFQVNDPSDTRPSAVDISQILKQLGVDSETLIAALLSDPCLRNKLDSLTIEQQFNSAIANIVEHVNWLNTFKECKDEHSNLPAEAESLHRMLLATIDDVRAVIIKLAFRIQRLRQLKHENPAIQTCIARETLDIYAPLANRLGTSNLKWELEDLAFRYTEPDKYKSLAKSMADKRANRESYIDNFVDYLQSLFNDVNIESRLYGRPKHLYSIWKKMQKKQMVLHELADLLAVRIITTNMPQCYMILSILHDKWQHLQHEFDDYIANPKENGYQSIHTAIIGPENQVVEIQIRTQEMHAFAEHGVAAHWRYKEGSNQDRTLLKSISTLRRLLDNRIDDNTLLEEFKTEFFTDRVLVLTPKKEVLELPKGSTALDFAYSIHTEIGHQCIGALVNGHRVPLSYPIKSGECIEILSDPDSQPHLDWLNPRKKYINTIRAKSRIKQWFNAHYKDENNNFIVSSNTLQGIGNHKVHLANCCNPKVGDPILGELLADKTIRIHHYDCDLTHSNNLNTKPKLIELNWGEETLHQRVNIHIDAFDRQGLLRDITQLLDQSQINVLRANTETDLVDQSVAMELLIELDDLDKLDMLLKKIVCTPNVFNAIKISNK